MKQWLEIPSSSTLCRCIYMLLFSITTSCDIDGGSPQRNNNPQSLRAMDVELKGTPIVKMLSRSNYLWLLSETITAKTDDHPRDIKYVSSDKQITNIQHALKPNEYITDMALGPQENEMWISLVSLVDPDTIIVRLINTERIIWEIMIPMPSKSSVVSSTSYENSGKTSDIVRISSEGESVYMVARNKYGFPFLAAIRNRKILQNPIIFGPALKTYHLGRDSGKYSVMDQALNRYKLHLTSCKNSIFVTWQVQGVEIRKNFDFYQTKIDNSHAEKLKYYLAVYELQKESFKAINPEPKLYQVGRTLLQGISCHEDDLVIAGHSRVKPNKQSAPFIVRNDQLFFLLDDFVTSTSIQAVTTANKKLIFGGSTDWNQNPHGASISGGLGYIKIGDKIDIFGKVRTEVRSISHNNKMICYAGMINGPTTHSHDSTPDTISGDGFLKCIPLI